MSSLSVFINLSEYCSVASDIILCCCFGFPKTNNSVFHHIKRMQSRNIIFKGYNGFSECVYVTAFTCCFVVGYRKSVYKPCSHNTFKNLVSVFVDTVDIKASSKVQITLFILIKISLSCNRSAYLEYQQNCIEYQNQKMISLRFSVYGMYCLSFPKEYLCCQNNTM